MLVIGHRGACGYVEENTLPSFELAISQGCRMIEFDVLSTQDHKPVVHHDDSLKRMTGIDMDVGSSTLEQIQKKLTKGGNQIPTLVEALRHINQRCEVNIELKGPNTGGITAETLLEMQVRPEQVLISSFHSKELQAFHQVLPKCRLAKLYRIFPVGLKQNDELPLYSIHVHHRACSHSLTKAVHKHGMKIYTFTCNSERGWNKAKDRKVDGVFSDVPDQALTFFDQ